MKGESDLGGEEVGPARPSELSLIVEHYIIDLSNTIGPGYGRELVRLGTQEPSLYNLPNHLFYASD
jgi:hypothetical protein